MRFFHNLLGAFIIIYLATGCVSAHHEIKGSNAFNPRNTVNIKPGQTTEDQVEQLLGDPTDTRSIDEGTDLWTYDREDVKVSSGLQNGGFPLLYVLTGGHSAPRLSMERHSVCQIVFKDGVVDAVEMMNLDENGNLIFDNNAEKNTVFYAAHAQGKSLDDEEKIIVFPVNSYSQNISIGVETQNFPLRITTLAFDISQLPIDIEVSGAVLHAFAMSKYRINGGTGEKKFPAPDIFSVYALKQQCSFSAYGLPAVDSSGKLTYSARSVPASLLSLLHQLKITAVQALDEPCWDTWVVTPYVNKALSSSKRTVYLMIGNEWATMPRYQLDQRVINAIGVKIPLLYQYHMPAKDSRDHESDAHLPYLEVYYRYVD